MITWPPPGFEPTSTNVIAWYELFARAPIAALIDLDLLMVADYGLVVVMFLAAGTALVPLRPTLALVGLTLVVVAAAVFLNSTPALAMKSLADQYPSAPEAERATLVAAGQATLAIYFGSPSYVLSALGGLLIAIAMRASSAFGRTTVWFGIATYVMNLIPPTLGRLALILSIVSLLPMVLWLSLLARDLLRLGRARCSI